MRSTQPATETVIHGSVQALSGRKRREESAQQILAATERLLARGATVAQLSVNQIVTEAGVSRATFYVCFEDKHSVIGQLAQASLSWREAVHAEVLGDPGLTHDDLNALMRAIVEHWQTHRPVLSAIIELAEHDSTTRKLWREAVNEIAEQAAGQFRVRWADSPDQPSDADTMAAVFTWALERCCHQLVTDDASADAIALAIAEILWRTLSYRSR